jgi:hypothetical protein
MAAAGRGMGAREHRHHPDLSDWNQRLQPHHCGVHYHVFFGGHQINFPGTYMPQFFFPTLLGNVIGGLAVVAALGHAQVVGGKEEQGKAKG